MSVASGKPDRASAEFAGDVEGMFDRIAGVYDAMNTAMTAGLHHRWRELAAAQARLGPTDSALDVACGTGDMTFALAKRTGPEGSVIGSDFSEGMLEIARRKAAERGLGPRDESGVRFERGDALALSYPDSSFDAVTIAFGARNLSDLDAGVAEMARVLRPGGRLVILEIVTPKRQPLATFHAIWFDRVVPVVGRVTGNSDAYSYLPESVKRFPSARGVAERVAAAGFTEVGGRLMAGGIIAIVAGTKDGASA